MHSSSLTDHIAIGGRGETKQAQSRTGAHMVGKSRARFHEYRSGSCCSMYFHCAQSTNFHYSRRVLGSLVFLSSTRCNQRSLFTSRQWTTYMCLISARSLRGAPPALALALALKAVCTATVHSRRSPFGALRPVRHAGLFDPVGQFSPSTRILMDGYDGTVWEWSRHPPSAGGDDDDDDGDGDDVDDDDETAAPSCRPRRKSQSTLPCRLTSFPIISTPRTAEKSKRANWRILFHCCRGIMERKCTSLGHPAMSAPREKEDKRETAGLARRLARRAR